MRVTQADHDWFHLQLQLSERAEVKQFYLALPPSVGKDLLQLSCEAPWRLEEALRAARLIVCDERQLCERLGDAFSARFADPLDPWNEQNAVKLVYQFLVQRRPAADGEAEETDHEPIRFTKALEAHMTRWIKPREMQGVCGRGGLHPVGSPQGGVSSSILAVVPMADGDAHSEGGLICGGVVRAFGELLRVRRSAMFVKETALQYCELGTVVRRDARLGNLLESVEALLVMCFLYELRVVGAARSHWRELLESCPSSFPTVPLFWELSDLRELVGTDILDVVLQQREESEKVAQTIQYFLPIIWENLSPTLGEVTFEEFTSVFSAESISFAKAVFNSRAFNLNIDGDVVLAMVPVADMINHQNRTDVLVRKVDVDGGDFVMLAGAPLDESDVGRELWMSYGPLQNWELLHNYGFVMPQNEHDKLPFPFQVAPADEDDTWSCRRHLLIEKYHLHLHGECWLAAHGVPSEALRALLRVNLAQPEEFEVMETHGPFTPLSATTEVEVVQTVEYVVQCVLEQFPNSLDEDKVILAEMIGAIVDTESFQDGEDGDNPHALDNYKLCLQLRIGLKEIAHRALEWCKSARAGIEGDNSG
ncbi:unnamed protein product [Phytomonas sp. EM1]|nr:unnamed protein product [Phytomonas sp. EM1]|eukprot:CCW61772.1 unnamed protein product [Phytomonas sp. isolate EM1]